MRLTLIANRVLTLNAAGRINERIPWFDAMEIARFLEVTYRTIPAAKYVDDMRDAENEANWIAAMPK